MRQKVLYVCDGKANCSIRGECGTSGSLCRHTLDVEHAKYDKHIDFDTIDVEEDWGIGGMTQLLVERVR